MIKYALKCPGGHQFESWFRDSAAYETLQSAGQVTCAICGCGGVEKAIMAPSVASKRRPSAPDAEAPTSRPLSAPASPAEAALAELRRKVEQNSDYVGKDFASEARRIHDGESEARSIYGEASAADAKGLLDDGIPVAPIPWMGRRND
jgi:hypothetical protein